MCSATKPQQSTGISHPPKSTILDFAARCTAFKAVLRSTGDAVDSDMRVVLQAQRAAISILSTHCSEGQFATIMSSPQIQVHPPCASTDSSSFTQLHNS